MSESTQHGTWGFSRRKFLAVAGAGIGAAALAACDSGVVGSSSTGTNGPKRKLILAFGFTLPFATPISVGAKDACSLAGWRYRQLFAPTSDFSQTTHENTVIQAINAKPDAILTGDWTKGFDKVVKQGQDAGIYMGVINAYNFPAELNPLGVTYVGPDEVVSGKAMAAQLIASLAAGAPNDAVIVAGNPFPASATTGARVQGLKVEIDNYNAAHGANYSLVTFEDQAGANAAQATTLYAAQISRLGNKLGGFAAVGGSASLPSLLKAVDEANLTGKTPIGTWDNDDVIVAALQKGQISFFKDQGNYYQGFYGALNSWAATERFTNALNMNTEAGFVTKDGLERWLKLNKIIAAEAKSI